ncbi:endodeoxyribonuclease [Tulasnella sp. 424]|nr:endodeoxyribonuclease [Tulasnella sp. 424]
MAPNSTTGNIKAEHEDDVSPLPQDRLGSTASTDPGAGDLIEELLATDVEIEEAIERRSYAISCLENLTHSLLHQLAEAMEEEDAHGRPCGHIELQLADRKSKSEGNVRDIYYKDPGLFGKQSVVDKVVDDLAATFDLDRSDLGVRASPKGLFAGSGLTIHLRQGGTVTGNDYDSTLIPCNAEISTLEISQDTAFVLVAVFQTLCRIGFPCHPLLNCPGIIITGKGYPDVATRELVNTFSSEFPENIPILALVDADPHGIEILSVFKYGSSAMDHQRDKLSAPRIQWIGVYASELQRRELSHMLHSRRKAEIEIICNATLPAAQIPGKSLSNYDLGFKDDLSISQVNITGSTLLAVYLASKINAAISESIRNSDDTRYSLKAGDDLVKVESFS